MGLRELKLVVPAKEYQAALDSQDACNLSGITRALARMTEAIWEEARANNQGTHYVNTHPICRLFAEQIMYLSGAGSGDTDTWQAAFTLCQWRALVAPGGKYEGRPYDDPDVTYAMAESHTGWRLREMLAAEDAQNNAA